MGKLIELFKSLIYSKVNTFNKINNFTIIRDIAWFVLWQSRINKIVVIFNKSVPTDMEWKHSISLLWWQITVYSSFTSMKNILLLKTTGGNYGYFLPFFFFISTYSFDLDLGTDTASLKDTSDYIIPLTFAMLLSAT